MNTKRLVFALVFAAGSIQAGSIKSVYYQGPLTPANITPTLDKGFLIVYNLERSISVYGPDGLPRFTAVAEVTGAEVTAIESAAVDRSGAVVAAVQYTIPLGGYKLRTGAGLAFFNPTGKQIRFVDTAKYRPTQVAFAEDHSIWTTGNWIKLADEHPDYFILHKYSPEGQELAAFLPRSSFDADFEPNWGYVGMWSLRVMNDRIVALLRGNFAHTLWIEVNLSGKELDRMPVPLAHDVAAFTPTGTIYSNDEHGTVSLFNRSKKAWQPVSGLPEACLLGADGEALVFWKPGSNVLQWVTPAQ